MIFAFFLAIVWIIFSIISIIHGDDAFEKIGPCVLGALVAFLLFLVTVALPTSLLDTFDENVIYEEAATIPLHALSDEADQDQYFISSEMCKDSLHYFFYYETKQGYRIEDVRADESTIVYTEKEPIVKRYDAVGFKNFWMYIFHIPSQSCYQFCIPEGSIANSFQIDMH